MTTIIERVARAICGEVGVDYDALPEKATYYQRKATSDALADRDEARDAARAFIEAMRYEDGIDEDIFVAVAAIERLDPVSLICAYDRVIDATLMDG